MSRTVVRPHARRGRRERGAHGHTGRSAWGRPFPGTGCGWGRWPPLVLTILPAAPGERAPAMGAQRSRRPAVAGQPM